MTFRFLENEYWYGGMVHIGGRLPISERDDVCVTLVGGRGACDQYSPLFLSSRGRILHSDRAFDVHFKCGEIIIDDRFSVTPEEGFGDLRSALREAAGRWFSLSGAVPDRRFFRTPQYNTWIELMYNQNQKDILHYARTLREGGMPAGVLMIDEGWSPDYGVYDFDPGKFEDPRAMIDELHAMGFIVMLWVTPMISPDGNCFRDLRSTDLLLRDGEGNIAVREWWNGYSCVLDFTNPATCEWFRGKLRGLMEKYGVDGFKFDCGDTYLYREGDRTHIPGEPNANTKAFNLFCSEFAFNELRNTWDCGGAPLVTRLQDKEPHWSYNGLGSLLPNMLTQGVLGYYFGCPDMVGGGAYGCFGEGYKTDEELYLRWLAASVLCPMVQFSISPKRILSQESFAALTRLLALRERYTDTIVSLVERAAVTGEPAMRYMEYEFPGEGFERVTDQFMLGSDILVAPILEPGRTSRTVKLPRGRWQREGGIPIEGGGTVELPAAIDELIVLHKMQN